MLTEEPIGTFRFAAAGQMEALLRAMLAQGTSGVALRRGDPADPPALPDARD